jgi:hypothetical protein
MWTACWRYDLYKELFIFVEGYKDTLLFSKIVELIFRKQYNWVSLIEWAPKELSKTDNYFKSIKSESWDADYIFVTDINDAPCVTAKKGEIKRRFGSVDKDRIAVVKREIESWYLAGLDEDKCKDLKIPSFRVTDDVTKEQFGKLISEGFGSEIYFMQELLKSFDIETAKKKNKSFRYFVEKYGLQDIDGVGNST